MPNSKGLQIAVRYLLTTFTLFSFCVHGEGGLLHQPLKLGLRESAVNNVNPRVFNLVHQAADRLSITLNFQPLPRERSIALAANGVLDGEFYRHNVIEPLYPSLIRVDEPVDHNSYWVLVPKSSDCMPNSESLSQLKPIGLRGAKFYQKHVYPLSDVGHEESNEVPQMLKMLELGRADYTVQSKLSANLLIEGDSAKLKTCLGRPLFSLPFYLYLHESNQHLVQELEQAIRAVKDHQAKLY